MEGEKILDANRTLTVGEVARRSGVAVSTIHFYEAKGLIKASRTASNHRQYPAIVLRYIAIIRVAQRVGMSLEEIGDTLSNIQAVNPTLISYSTARPRTSLT